MTKSTRPGRWVVINTFRKCPLTSQTAQHNALIFQADLQIFQDLGGVLIHIHDGLGIDEEEGHRLRGRVDHLLHPVGEIGGIKKEERPGKAVR